MRLAASILRCSFDRSCRPTAVTDSLVEFYGKNIKSIVFLRNRQSCWNSSHTQRDFFNASQQFAFQQINVDYKNVMYGNVVSKNLKVW